MKLQDIALLLLAVPMALIYSYMRWKSPSASKTHTRLVTRPSEVTYFTPKEVRRNAQRLRNLPKKPAPADCGIHLGTLVPRGPELRATWEDTILAIMGPRAGHKTTGLAIPTILEAPGPVIVTSNKTDSWAATAALREGGAHESWTFDPQHMTHTKQTWWWNPLQHITDVETANRLAGMFVNTISDDNRRDIWAPAAQELLGALFLAARLDDTQRSLHDVWRWLSQETTPEPGYILHEKGPLKVAESLDGIQDMNPKTRSGVYFTARTAARCLADDRILRWVTPPTEPYIAEFGPEWFISSSDTLYMLSKDGGGSAAPLVAAFTDRIFTAAVNASEKHPGGRLDPPLIAVLDEAANVCRIADLPQLYSHFGSRGIIPLTILQSYSQANRVWGKDGATDLFAASTAILIGAGNNDANFLSDMSRLLGEREIPNTTLSVGGGRTNRTWAPPREEAVMSPGVLRALERGQALLLAAGMKPALIKLKPWYKTRHKKTISAAVEAAQRGIAERSQALDAA